MASDLDTKIEFILPDAQGIVKGLYDGLKGVADDAKKAMTESTAETFTALTLTLMFTFGTLYMWRKVGAISNGGNS